MITIFGGIGTFFGVRLAINMTAYEISKAKERKTIKKHISNKGYDIEPSTYKKLLKEYENDRMGNFSDVIFYTVIPLTLIGLCEITSNTYYRNSILNEVEYYRLRRDLLREGKIKRNEEIIDERINNAVFHDPKVRDLDIEYLKYDDELLYYLYKKRIELKEKYIEENDYINNKEEQLKQEKRKLKLSKDAFDEYRNALLSEKDKERRKALIRLDSIEEILLQYNHKYSIEEKEKLIRELLTEEEINEFGLDRYISKKEENETEPVVTKKKSLNNRINENTDNSLSKGKSLSLKLKLQ